MDRVRRRRVQIVADLARAALFGSLPIVWRWHLLTLWQLYAAVLLSGTATVFFDVAAQSYLPFVVGRPGLVAANSRLASVDAINQVAGRSVGGYLVQALTAPLAIAVDAATYLWSAAWLLRIRRTEPKPEPRPDVHLPREVREGVGFVFGHPLLRPIAMAGTLTNLSVQISVVMLPVLFIRELKLSPGVLGLYLTSGGLGVLLGTTAARGIGNRLGHGRAMWIVGLASMPFKAAIPFLNHGPLLWLAALGWLSTTFQVGINNVSAGQLPPARHPRLAARPDERHLPVRDDRRAGSGVRNSRRGRPVRRAPPGAVGRHRWPGDSMASDLPVSAARYAGASALADGTLVPWTSYILPTLRTCAGRGI